MSMSSFTNDLSRFWRFSEFQVEIGLVVKWGAPVVVKSSPDSNLYQAPGKSQAFDLSLASRNPYLTVSQSVTLKNCDILKPGRNPGFTLRSLRLETIADFFFLLLSLVCSNSAYDLVSKAFVGPWSVKKKKLPDIGREVELNTHKWRWETLYVVCMLLTRTINWLKNKTSVVRNTTHQCRGLQFHSLPPPPRS